MINFKNFILVLLTCSALTLFSLFLHVSSFTNTMVNYVDENNQNDANLMITDGFLPWSVNYHKTLPDFKARPVTTFFIEKFVSWFNLRISIAYVWVNFLFTFFNGFLVYYLVRLYALSNKQALLSSMFLYGSFSVLLAYFVPIATYDEPIQYFFILLSFIFLKINRLLFFAGSFALAVITRENSLLLLPAIFLFYMHINFKTIWKQKAFFSYRVFISGIPVLIYIAYLVYYFYTNPQQIEETNALLPGKFTKFERNFNGWINFSRTLLSFISVYLVPIFLLLYYRLKHQWSKAESKWMMAFWLTFVINTILVFFSSYAEESRVLTLPILIIIPLFGKIISDLIVFSQSFFNYLLCTKRVLVLFVSTSLAWLLFEQMYKLTNFNMNDNLYREYNTISVLFIVLVLLYSRFSITQKPPKQNN